MKLSHFVKSIRARITLWHLVVLVLTLILFMFFSQMFLWHQLTIELKGSLRDDVEVVESSLQAGTGGKIAWAGHREDLRGQERWIEVSRLDGETIFRNKSLAETFASLKPDSLVLHAKTFHSLRLDEGTELLVIQEVHQVAGERLLITVGRSKDRLWGEMGHLFLVQGFMFPLAVLLAWLGGYFVAGRALSPLKKIISRMNAISAERLDDRLPVENPEDELGQLSLAFNDLLSKLDQSFGQMKQFTADASHELRTPLSSIRSVGEMALRTEQSKAGYQETIASMLEEVERMARLVNDLLALARADSTVAPALELQDLGEVVTDEVSRLEVLAEEKGQSLSLEIDQPCPVRLDRRIFRQAFGNLLHNAIKYTPEGKGIRIVVGAGDGGCFVDIADSGPGIGPEHQAQVFDRFYRVDKVRSRETGGSGLGLAIAKRAVSIHGGRIELHSEPGHGCTFRIWLPGEKLPKDSVTSFGMAESPA